MKFFSTFLYTLVSRLLITAVVVLFFVPLCIAIIIIPQKYRYNRYYFWIGNLFFKAIVKATLLPIHIKGKLEPEPAIIVANHSSSLDIPILSTIINGHPNVWLAMTWLLNFWFFRLILPRIAVLVDMSSPQKGVRSLIKTIKLVKQQHMQVIIFPEGGRYTDGKVHDFYGGFGILSEKTGYPVVPIRLFHLEKVYPPNTFWLQYHPVSVIIGEPMYKNEDESQEDFQKRVHTWFVDQE